MWGPLEHFGQECHYRERRWHRSQAVTAQLTGFRAVPGSLLGMFAPAKRRDGLRFTMADHMPHHYIAALRPSGRVTEFGDRG